MNYLTKYKWEDYDEDDIETEIHNLLWNINPEVIKKENSYYKNKLYVNKSFYRAIYEKDGPEWRIPCICADIEFTNDKMIFYLKQEEYCGSTCKTIDNRCDMRANWNYYSAEVTNEEIGVNIKKSDKYLIRDIVENNPKLLGSILNKSENEIDKWLTSELVRESKLWNK